MKNKSKGVGKRRTGGGRTKGKANKHIDQVAGHCGFTLASEKLAADSILSEEIAEQNCCMYVQSSLAPHACTCLRKGRTIESCMGACLDEA